MSSVLTKYHDWLVARKQSILDVFPQITDLRLNRDVRNPNLPSIFVIVKSNDESCDLVHEIKERMATDGLMPIEVYIWLANPMR
jgi:hypothetical protein